MIVAISALAFVAVAIVAVLSTTVVAQAFNGEHDLDKSFLTANVQAPHNADFDVLCNFSFDRASKSEDADYPLEESEKCKLVVGDGDGSSRAKNTAQIEVNAVNGVLMGDNVCSNYGEISSIVANAAKNDWQFVAQGHGTSAADSDPVTFNGDSTNYGYIHAQRLSSLVNIPEGKKIKEIFPQPGRYTWLVTSTIDPKSPWSDVSKWWTESKSQYEMVMWVKEGTDDYAIDGVVFYQINDDRGYEIQVDKKNPESLWDHSNHGCVCQVVGHEEDTKEGLYYEGFTFVYSFLLDPDHSGDMLMPFEIGKKVTASEGAFPDYNKEFNFNQIQINSDTLNGLTWDWDDTNKIYVPRWEDSSVVGAIIEKDDTGAFRRFIKEVQFEIEYAGRSEEGFYVDGPAIVYPVDASGERTSVNLKHNQFLVFSGETYTDGTASCTTTKLPTGSVYQVQDQAEVGYKPHVDVYTANLREDTTGVGPLNPEHYDAASHTTPLFVRHPKMADTGSKTFKNATVGQVEMEEVDDEQVPISKNLCLFTNEHTVPPSGFMLDCVPYIIMIGIPILAFAIWLVSRKRRANNR